MWYDSRARDKEEEVEEEEEEEEEEKEKKDCGGVSYCYIFKVEWITDMW